MAYTTKTVEDVDVGGTAATYTAVPGTGSGNGFQIANDPAHRTIVDVDAAGGAVVVTLVTPGTDDGLAVADRTVTVGAGPNKFIPLRRNYKQSDGNNYLDFDVSASVTVAAIKVTAE